MRMSRNQCYLAFCAFIVTIQTVNSIRCYRCTSTDVENNTLQCNEYFDDSELEPQSCDDVYGAQYCVKQIGRFGGSGIKCFQCSSTSNISCSDLLIHEGGIEATDCDHIFEAEYCIKMTGVVHGGKIGTKRDCSAADLGNYCNYVQLDGDKLEYRSCYFTCTGDGCNSAPERMSTWTWGLMLLVLLLPVLTNALVAPGPLPL